MAVPSLLRLTFFSVSTHRPQSRLENTLPSFLFHSHFPRVRITSPTNSFIDPSPSGFTSSFIILKSWLPPFHIRRHHQMASHQLALPPKSNHQPGAPRSTILPRTFLRRGRRRRGSPGKARALPSEAPLPCPQIVALASRVSARKANTGKQEIDVPCQSTMPTRP